METEILDDIKVKLSIPDQLEDEKILKEIGDVIHLFEFFYSQPPDNRFKTILKDIALKRYIRTGDEGVKISKLEGRQNTYESQDANPFEDYDTRIRALLDETSSTKKPKNGGAWVW